jgi:exosortase K
VSEQRHGMRATVVWWSLAAGVAVALKMHFSAAATSDLEWMLRPVAMLLRLVTGWRFSQTDAGEWYSLDAGIVLVKACAGINFMTLSFLGWCWLCRPRYAARLRERVGEWPILLGCSLLLAWGTALVVNSLRIVAIVHWQPALEQWLPAEEAHRFLGLVIYVTALNAQVLMFDRRRWRRSVLVACAGYAALMLGVPLVTGNAIEDIDLYLRNAVTSLLVLLPFVAVASVQRWRSHAVSGLVQRDCGLPPRVADDDGRLGP